jgi:DNA-directed RNA polymerase
VNLSTSVQMKPYINSAKPMYLSQMSHDLPLLSSSASSPSPLTSHSHQKQGVLSIHPAFIQNRIRGLPETAETIRQAKSIEMVENLADEYPYAVSEEQQREQLLFEIEAITRAAQKFKKLVDTVIALNRGACLAPGTELTVQWFRDLREYILHVLSTPSTSSLSTSTSTASTVPSGLSPSPQSRRKKSELSLPTQTHNTTDNNLMAILSSISVDKLAVITIHVVLSSVLRHRDSISTRQLALDIGNALQTEYNFERLRTEADNIYERVYGKSRSVVAINRMARQKLEDVNWPKTTKIAIGNLLIQGLIKAARITHKHHTGVVETAAAFTEGVVVKRKRAYTVLRAHEYVFSAIDPYTFSNVQLSQVRHFPMMIPPRPWLGPLTGGYFSHQVPILRYDSFEEQMGPVMERSEHLTSIYEALTALGETPWRINQFVLDVVKEVWRRGGNLAEIPDRRDKPFPLPLPPEGKSPAWFKRLRKIQQQNYDLTGLRCDFLLKLEVAEKFRNRVFYFPHNMDFRGRVYPIPPHLNHMGSDLSRGLLLFAESKPLGPRGLHWLKIQLANFYGLDKLSFEDRLAFVASHMREIEDSADRPLSGERWWLQADNPWQCLAACRELTAALRHPDPTQYACALPIQQDGSCNVLQHYAALGGDEQGASSVNLLPGPRPRDVYSDVVELVRARVNQDADNGLAIAQLLKGKVDRKVIKQTVMTSVYGVTFIGARQQIANAIKDHRVLHTLTEEQRFQASVYLSKLTFESIRQLFTGARSIMDWLTKCARLIAKKGRPVTWITPLGLPVVQAYRRPANRDKIATVPQVLNLNTVPSEFPIHKMRQRTAFPPNFIHSLDSTHMLLTALACKQRNITYASVHDSYWTHASTVDEMNVILREKFVQLHSRPILKQLRDYWVTVHPDIEFPELPSLGSFDLTLVCKSPYFFH